MYKHIVGKNNSVAIVNNETATGSVELTIESAQGEQQYIQLSNGELMSLAMALLECVEYTRK